MLWYTNSRNFSMLSQFFKKEPTQEKFTGKIVSFSMHFNRVCYVTQSLTQRCLEFRAKIIFFSIDKRDLLSCIIQWELYNSKLFVLLLPECTAKFNAQSNNYISPAIWVLFNKSTGWFVCSILLWSCW